MSAGSQIVLGVNLGHDRSACVAIGGEVHVAIAEERLSRVKHDIPLNSRGERFCCFPHRAAHYCLAACGVGYGDVDLVAASTTYVLDTGTGRRRGLLPEDITSQCGGLAGARVEIFGHHLTHAASASLCSGFPSAAVLVVDGGGSPLDGSSALERTSIFHLRAGSLRLVRRSVGGPPAYGNSIGDLYQMVTCHLGFRAGEEGKTMGLAGFAPAARGTRWEPLPEFQRAIAVDDGVHQVADELQYTADDGYHPHMLAAFGPPRARPRPDDPLDREIAASAQWAIEEGMLQLARDALRITGERRLCLAGGVALNCVANGRLLNEGDVDDLFVQPAASDDGTALGCALLGSESARRAPTNWTFRSPYLGRRYSPAELAAALTDAGLSGEPCEAAAARIADDIADGAIVALFRGGCEFGPRALGHRSILCDPRRPEMAEHLNARVKHREAFRPFAPIVLEERAADFFELDVPSPYMLLSARVRRPDAIPAVTHVDGSARVQTVSRAQEPFLWEVIEGVRRRTGVPVVLNTSFNDREPIVETPFDAMCCFLRTGIDVLYLEDMRIAAGAA
ncbi:MAG: carbamoyltransferase [Gaiellaceae bacterium]